MHRHHPNNSPPVLRKHTPTSWRQKVGFWKPNSCLEKQGREPGGSARQPCPRRSGPAGRGPGSAALAWGPRSGSGAASSRYFMARARRRASRGGRTPSACESSELDEARGLDPQPHAEARGKAVLLSGPQAEAFQPPELLSALALGLVVRAAYHSGMTGTVRAITPTRVSHHSEPAKIEADNGWLTHYSICPQQIPAEIL